MTAKSAYEKEPCSETDDYIKIAEIFYGKPQQFLKNVIESIRSDSGLDEIPAMHRSQKRQQPDLGRITSPLFEGLATKSIWKTLRSKQADILGQ